MSLPVSYSLSFFVMLSKMISDLILLCANCPDICSAESVPLMSSVANVTVGAGGVIRYPPLYSVVEYIL